MATSKDNKKQEVLAKLLSKRDENVRNAQAWKQWEIEEQLERAKAAKESFLTRDPNHDVSIIDEHISQLVLSLEIKLENKKPPEPKI